LAPLSGIPAMSRDTKRILPGSRRTIAVLTTALVKKPDLLRFCRKYRWKNDRLQFESAD
jgi:hypothetical protein